MTIKELKQKIENLPDYMNIFMAERVTEFSYGLVNSAYVRQIDFIDEVGGEVISKDEALILNEQ